MKTAQGMCPACEFKRLTATGLVTDSRFKLLACGRCRTQFFVDTSSSPSDGDSQYWQEAYKFDLYGDDAIRNAFEQRYAGMLDLAMAEVTTVQSVLDFGCGIGNFLSFAEGRGLKAFGSDVEPDAIAAARRRGFQAYLVADLDSALAPESVDALSMWDVIEHLIEPGPVLASALSKLRPGGALLLETPDGGFPVRSALLALNRLTRGAINLTAPMYYWEHKIYFTEQGIRALLDSVGADIVSVQRRTSLREKMNREFGVLADRGSRKGKLLAITWPILETGFRRAGRGNKLLVVARKR